MSLGNVIIAAIPLSDAYYIMQSPFVIITVFQPTTQKVISFIVIRLVITLTGSYCNFQCEQTILSSFNSYRKSFFPQPKIPLQMNVSKTDIMVRKKLNIY